MSIIYIQCKKCPKILTTGFFVGAVSALRAAVALGRQFDAIAASASELVALAGQAAVVLVLAVGAFLASVAPDVGIVARAVAAPVLVGRATCRCKINATPLQPRVLEDLIVNLFKNSLLTHFF